MGRLERNIDPQALETARAKAKPHQHASAGPPPPIGVPLPPRPSKDRPVAYRLRRMEKETRRLEREARNKLYAVDDPPKKRRQPCFIIGLGLNRYDIRERKPRLKPRKPAKTYKKNGKRESARRLRQAGA